MNTGIIHRMLTSCLLLGGFFMLPSTAGCQRIWVAEYPHQADVAVYMADYPHQAHLLVWEAAHAHQASSGEGCWHLVEYRHQAELSIYVTQYAHQADLVIALVDHRHQAGWRQKPPGLSLALMKSLRFR